MPKTAPSEAPEAVEVTEVFPTIPGKAIDLLFKKRTARLKKQAELKKMTATEDALEAHIIGLLNPLQLASARGAQAQATITTRVVPTIEDDAKFFAYLKRTGQFDLLQKRLAVTAVRERWDDHAEVPGVGRFSERVLHLTKV